jgi:hypothetical protein
MGLSRFWEANSPRLLKNLITLYRIGNYITVFTRSRHWSLSWAIWINFITTNLILCHFNIILPSTIGFPSGLLLSSLSRKLRMFYPLPHACYIPWPSHSSSLELSNYILNSLIILLMVYFLLLFVYKPQNWMTYSILSKKLFFSDRLMFELIRHSEVSGIICTKLSLL